VTGLATVRRLYQGVAVGVTGSVSPENGEKRVGWAELFFDLVFVFAVTGVSALIEDDHSWAGMLGALVVFVPLYWTWVGAAVRTNQDDASRPAVRLSLFAIALASIFMAVAVPQAYGPLGLVFALAYWAGRIVLVLPQLRWMRNGSASTLNPVSVSVVLTGPLLVVGALSTARCGSRSGPSAPRSTSRRRACCGPGCAGCTSTRRTSRSGSGCSC
jgi:low temperature requirement protein LtrA